MMVLNKSLSLFFEPISERHDIKLLRYFDIDAPEFFALLI